ncbi:hypothetical protein LRH25_02545 [Ideonella azotifigens]|uniref:Uncharacterized protein n=1 Tax=Ideonella azotifigens TaxID=513160 RepID=A0ABN1KKN1_9BURK|nr:hypothetical protein [Ideonella azotifigens]MCD2339214.1 hypothetical protein [Ideonella azotifigens]
MTWLSWCLIALFLLKLTWNMLVPCFLERAARAWKRGDGPPPGGVSMSPIVEMVLLVVAAVWAAFHFQNDRPAVHAASVLGIGVALTGLSYLAAVLLGRHLRRDRRSRSGVGLAE